MSETVQLSCADFVEVLASKNPTPGGGGACALVGALAAALGNMVGSLTVGKERYANVQEEIVAMNAEAKQLQEELLSLVDADAEAFGPVAAAYRMPKETPEQCEARSAAIQAGLAPCCEVPLQVMRACVKVVNLCGAYARKGSAAAMSDAGCGAVMAKAACQAASLNVSINTRSIKDLAVRQRLEAEADALLDEASDAADAVFTYVEEEL